MKNNIFILLIIFACKNAAAIDLCLSKEKLIFSFETKNKKVLSICKADNDNYLVYRFGTTERIELVFPEKLDRQSWRKFEFSGMRRSGGKTNSGFGDYSLIFDTGIIGYTIFQEWNDEDNTYKIGVIVSGKGKPVTIDGVKKTQKGSLVLLEDSAKKIPNMAAQN